MEGMTGVIAGARNLVAPYGITIDKTLWIFMPQS